MKRFLLIALLIFNINPAAQNDQFQPYSKAARSWIMENKALGYFPIFRLFKQALNIRDRKKDCENKKAQEIFNIIDTVGNMNKRGDFLQVNHIFLEHLNELCKDTMTLRYIG